MADYFLWIAYGMVMCGFIFCLSKFLKTEGWRNRWGLLSIYFLVLTILIGKEVFRG